MVFVTFACLIVYPYWIIPKSELKILTKYINVFILASTCTSNLISYLTINDEHSDMRFAKINLMNVACLIVPSMILFVRHIYHSVKGIDQQILEIEEKDAEQFNKPVIQQDDFQCVDSPSSKTDRNIM